NKADRKCDADREEFVIPLTTHSPFSAQCIVSDNRLTGNALRPVNHHTEQLMLNHLFGTRSYPDETPDRSPSGEATHEDGNNGSTSARASTRAPIRAKRRNEPTSLR